VTYLVRMRSKFRPAAVVLVLVAALAATGCAPEPAAPHTPAPTSTPPFASDEEALAAAEEAYAAYQTVEDQVFVEGGEGVDRIRPVAVREALQAALNGFESFQEKGYRATGSTHFDSLKLQQFSANAKNGEDIVSVYMCLDFSSTDVLDQQNVSVVREDSPARQPFLTRFDVNALNGGLVLSSREPWTDNGQCAA